MHCAGSGGCTSGGGGGGGSNILRGQTVLMAAGKIIIHQSHSEEIVFKKQCNQSINLKIMYLHAFLFIYCQHIQAGEEAHHTMVLEVPEEVLWVAQVST